MATKSYNQIARERFTATAALYNKEIDWIMGEGRYAVVANCQNFTISLHETRDIAKKSRGNIDVTGCGSNCIKEHFVIDLDK